MMRCMTIQYAPKYYEIKQTDDLIVDGASKRTTYVDAEAAQDAEREPTVRRVVPHVGVASAENARMISRWEPLLSFILDSGTDRVVVIVYLLHNDTLATRGTDLGGLGHLQVISAARSSGTR